MNFMTTRAAAINLGVTLRTVQNHCKALGFSKAGRDYLLTPGRVEQIRQYMADHPRGGKKKIKKALATNKEV